MIDAVVVGSGPNGLAAAITLARAGRSVTVVEAASVAGGGLRTEELTMPGFQHDVCSSVLPLAVGSPFFSRLPLGDYGADFTDDDIALAHPLDGGHEVLLRRSLEATTRELGGDGEDYARLLRPFVARAPGLYADLLGPWYGVRHPLLTARFGLQGVRSATGLATGYFHNEPTRALIAGTAAHSIVPLDMPTTAGFALVLLVAAHTNGWPVARGGSQRLADALVAYLQLIGGTVATDHPVRTMKDLPPSRVVLFDTNPGQLARIAAKWLPRSFLSKLRRFRHGPAVFKIDYALAQAIPWAAPGSRSTATVHIGGRWEEVAASEAAVARGQVPDRPFVIVAQPSVVDASRAPDGQHTAWAYCHVPNGCNLDMTARIEDQLERFAPGFRDVVVGRRVSTPRLLEERNPNDVGGDIAGGSNSWRQLVARPVLRADPYSTPHPRIFICSASTPPGGGVHGMCGYHAARSALRTSLR